MEIALHDFVGAKIWIQRDVKILQCTECPSHVLTEDPKESQSLFETL